MSLKVLSIFKYWSFAVMITCVSIQGYGQYNSGKVNKKAAQLYTQALEKANDGQYREAISILKAAANLDRRFADAYLSIAGLHGELKEYADAVEYYEKAKSIDSNYFKDYALPYSINLAGTGNFEEALSAVNHFLSSEGLNASSVKIGEYRRQCYQFAIEYEKQKSLSAYKFEPENMGDSINSAVSEYFPAITIDKRQFLYTRRVDNINEDFYESSKKDGKWTKSGSLKGNINTELNEGAQNISQDGEWLIFTGCHFPEGQGSCDLYISFLTSQGWSAPENLGRKINTDAWESAPSLSPDKRDLYFASNRPGGYGASDIYVSHRQADGTWSDPENAGPQINTAGNESCPFIHADNQTLYFTSNGHTGYGGDDLFLVRKENNNKWQAAVNLGYPINTIENEGSLIVASDGKSAYYASDRSDSRGGLDIYSFELREDIRPAKTLWVKGKVYDLKTKKGLPSAIALTDLSTRQVLSQLQTDETGNYLITLPVGRDYAFSVNRKGYLLYSENFSLKHHPADSTYFVEIPLQPLEMDASVVLKNIFFDVNQFELKVESFTELDNILKLLNENPSLHILILGHTDNTGNASDNLKLSNARAKAVIEYLAEKGIDIKRLSSKGLGATQPIADNTTEEGKAKNRRTELKILKQ